MTPKHSDSTDIPCRASDDRGAATSAVWAGRLVLLVVLIAVTTAPAVAATGASSAEASPQHAMTDVALTTDSTFATDGSSALETRSTTGAQTMAPSQAGAEQLQSANLPNGTVPEDGAFTDVIATSDGGYVLVGWLEHSNGQQGWIAKIRGNGTTAWERTYGDADFARFASVESADDGYVVAGSRIDGDNVDGWAMKVDESGDVRWERTTGGDRTDGFREIVPAHDGDYLLAGYTKSEGSGTLGWTVAFDDDGTVGEAETYSSIRSPPASQIYAGIQTDDGYLFVGQSSDRGWALRTDAEGEVVWNQRYADYDDNLLHDVVANEDGDFVAVGRTTGSDHVVDAWALRLSGDGEVEWERTIEDDGDDWFLSAVSADDGYLLVGPNGREDDSANARALKIHENGTEDWDVVYGGGLWDTFWTATAAHDGGYLLAGKTSSYGADADTMVVRVAGPASRQIEDAEPSEPGVTLEFDETPVRSLVLHDAADRNGIVSLVERPTAPDATALPGDAITTVDVSAPNAVENAPATVTLELPTDRLPDGRTDGAGLAVATHDGEEWHVVDTAVDGESADGTVTFRAELDRADTFAVVALSEPTVEISNDEVVSAGDDLTLSADADAAGDVDVESYEWTIDGERLDAASSETATVTVDDPGEHEVGLTVRDEHGTTATATTTVLVDDRPSLSPTAPDTATVDEPVQFDAGVENEVGDVTVTWQLDGETVTGTAVEHAFDEPGEHEVTVVAEDEYGERATAEFTVDVREDGTDDTRRTRIGLGIVALALVAGAGIALYRR